MSGFWNFRISYACKSRIDVVLQLQKPYSLWLKKRIQTIFTTAKSFRLRLILYTSKEAFHGLNSFSR